VGDDGVWTEGVRLRQGRAHGCDRVVGDGEQDGIGLEGHVTRLRGRRPGPGERTGCLRGLQAPGSSADEAVAGAGEQAGEGSAYLAGADDREGKGRFCMRGADGDGLLPESRAARPRACR
jgi:hypothetical protein